MVNNLARLYLDQKQYQKAELLFQKSLAVKEKALGPDHPDVATSLGNLADLYQAQRRYDEAEPLYKRALEIRVKSLGPNHPDVVATLNSYATLLRQTRRKTEALELDAGQNPFWPGTLRRRRQTRRLMSMSWEERRKTNFFQRSEVMKAVTSDEWRVTSMKPNQSPIGSADLAFPRSAALKP